MTEFLTQGAWELEHSSKLDILQEPQHIHLIHKFLSDSETKVEREDKDHYILAGHKEAVLVIPTRTITLLLLFWAHKIKQLAS
jgi:hypothetical protein